MMLKYIGNYQNIRVFSISRTVSNSFNPFFDTGLDGLIIYSRTGKTDFGGFIDGLINKKAKILVDYIYKIKSIINAKENPRLVLVNTIIDKQKSPISLKYICLIPSAEATFYKNFTRVLWSTNRSEEFKRRNADWRDYIYAAIYLSLLIISKKTDIRRLGISYKTYNPYSDPLEYIIDAVNNFAALNQINNSIEEIIFLDYYDLRLPLYITPPHREISHSLGYDKCLKYDYIDFELSSPLNFMIDHAKCTKCHGIGKKNNYVCPYCNGTGKRFY